MVPRIIWLAAAVAAIEPSERDKKLLFQESKFVEEPITPAQFAQKVLSATSGEDCNPKTFLLYAAWCPHCHAFAPRWEEFAQVLDTCVGGKQTVNAFECTSQAKNRTSSSDDWLQAGLPKSQELPTRACEPFLSDSYPTVGVFLKKRCELLSPAEKVIINTEEVPWFPNELAYYRIPMGGLGKSLGSTFDAFRESGLFAKCSEGITRDADYDALTKMLKTLKLKTPAEDENGQPEQHRWTKDNLITDPHQRLHDAVLGVYFLLKDWTTVNARELGDAELTATKNFLRLVALLPGDAKVQAERLIQDLEQHPSAEAWVSQLRSLKIYDIDDVPESGSALRSDISITCHSDLCLVWTLIHVLSQRILDLVEKNPGVLTARLDTPDALFPPDGLPHPSSLPVVIYQVVKTFFSCQTCREHFKNGFENNAANRDEWTNTGVKGLTDHEQLVNQAIGTTLWWWRFHNIVDVRTALDKAMSALRQQMMINTTEFEIPFDGEDVRFPPRSLCPECYKESPEKSFYMSKKMVESFIYVDEDESKMRYDRWEEFNLEKVLDVLRSLYSLDVVVDQPGSEASTELADASSKLVWDSEIHRFEASQPASQSVSQLIPVYTAPL